MKPLAIDLFCGLGGWTEGFLAEGYEVVGFDIEPRPYPGQLVLQDVLTVHGSQFKDAVVIVASPPCQAYSYRAMPWKRAKALPPPDNTLFEACFRIQREACEAAGRYIPLVVENVRGAQKWVGQARWNFGSYYLWGDVPALMPFAFRIQKFNPDGTEHPPGSWFKIADSQNRGASAIKNNGGSWFAIAHNTTSGHGQNPDGRKVPGLNWSGSDKPGYKAQAFNTTAEARPRDGTKQNGSGAEWFDNGIAKHSSRSDSRKAASAQIAKIPFPLAQHIARVYRPYS